MKTIKTAAKVKAILGEGGQVTIPIYIRKQYNLKRGDLVVFVIRECVIEGGE
jgi:bifunctional DNA-binding transcriptional regulator/antitoxin component of YhaV-PrlF toxin-antitoxin module